MWNARILFLLQFLLPHFTSGQGTFECGDHGRFEYCIDEIPGCVIGCHCHPGYYFDTNTKICEPNSRLIDHQKRRNVIEPTQEQKIGITSNIKFDAEPTSSTSKIDGQVDEITKDANDLGDWLYNQFFKTIENQVINNTNDKDPLTRRSGSLNKLEQPKRKTKWRKGGKSPKKKRKKEHLKRKLLRITENDSLFDISSESNSESSSSSSDSSAEYDTNEYRHNHNDDDEHGHKKIVVINKKPKQALPSFIFLPNLDTPFYPPIGLPPPPIVPMYPMVPVPPVPLCPLPGCDDIEDKHHVVASTLAATSASVTAVTTSTVTAPSTIVTSITTVPSQASETTTVRTTAELVKTTNAPSKDMKLLRLKNKRKKNNDRANTIQGINNMNGIDRQKFLKSLREKMSNPSAKLLMPSWKRNKKIFANAFVNQNIDTETPFLDNRLTDETYNNEINSKAMHEDSAFPDNVDFKYITELIHRVDLNNKSTGLPPIEYNPMDSIEVYRPSKLHKNQLPDYSSAFDAPDGRRVNHPTYHYSDESYYANLGRQIATMIRGTDTQNRQTNIEIDNMPNKRKNDQYFNNNSPTSFWERSVRSPLTLLKANNKNFEYLKRSNELLFDIENKVEIIASTAPALSLQEIENIVNVMEAAKREIQSNDKQTVNYGTSNNNLNIDLWPQKSHSSYILRNKQTDTHKDNNFQNSLRTFLFKDRHEKSINNDNKLNKVIKSLNNIPNVQMHSIKNVVTWNTQNVNRNIKRNNQTSNSITTIKPSNKNGYFDVSPITYNLDRPNPVHQFLARSNPFPHNNIKQSFLNQQMSPLFLGHRKYFQDRNNYYLNQNEEISHQPSPEKVLKVQPSYFHHEINHFDFIE